LKFSKKIIYFVVFFSSFLIFKNVYADPLLDKYNNLIVKDKSASDLVKINDVNSFFNSNIIFRSDFATWGKKDYWATPLEFIRKRQGDCEDYAIAKYFSLRRMNIPVDRLKIAYVTTSRSKEAHMVLLFYKSENNIPLVLDNLINNIKSLYSRKDLNVIYTFNEKFVWMNGGKNNVGSSKRINLWRNLNVRKSKEKLFFLNDDQT